MWPFAAERVIPSKELRWGRRVLTSPRTVREISRSSVLAEQGRLIAFPMLPPERSGVERRTLRHIERPWTSFRLGGCFSLWGCLRRKAGASARLAGPVIILCALRGFTSTQDATRRGATSRARAGCKFVLSTLLATIALFAASTVPTHAQTHWTGTFSSNWFLAGNWDAGFPRQTDDANINTVTPNSTVISEPGRTSQESVRRCKRDRDAHNPGRRDIGRFLRGGRQFTGRAGHGDGDRRGLQLVECRRRRGRRPGHGHSYNSRRRHGRRQSSSRRLDRIGCRLDGHGDGDRPRLHLEQRTKRRAQYRQLLARAHS